MGNPIRKFHLVCLCTAGSVIAAGIPATVSAQDSGGADLRDAIVVTGSRIQRDGYDAPSPLTVVDADALADAAPTNVADYINQMPQLVGSSTLRTGNGGTSGGAAGLNLLNLRGLGANRTLVLIDGQRVAPSTQTGGVNINNVPSALLERVDIVTGGASAAYGSDAVAGVVNFIIDENFEGIRANIMGGVTDRGDNKNYALSAAFGHAFANDSGVFLASVEHQHEDTIPFVDRDWYNFTYLVPNPAYAPGNGEPRQIVSPNVYYNNVAQGGVITTTGLAGTMFGQGGEPLPFVYGTIAGNFMLGGNAWNEGNVVALTPEIDRTNVWARVAYEFSPAIKATLEGGWGTARTINRAAYQRYAGNLTMSASNPFLPQSVRDQATTLGVTSFRYGYSTYDLDVPVNDIERANYRIVATLSGEFGDDWNWSAYYQYGHSDIRVELLNSTNRARFTEA
ncbi:MAG: TonB-dependent receptor plug domain-containing protein, partial [Gammaproteobacteria bacterium]|nr:TonB-dependent receptor plug domain-containing protein [Gammaproteobacteria bacterium]